MVPLSEYATVKEGATLFEAVMALEHAQEEFDIDHSKYHHRAVLVLDKKDRVIGKLSQLNVLRALEPKDEQISKTSELGKFGFSLRFITTLREQYRLAGVSLSLLCANAAKMKVEDYMKTPSEGEYVEENTPLDTAIYQLVTGLHLSLLVTRDTEIVGVLRMSDVFAAVFHAMRESESEEKAKDE
jgi:CBS domain-containing protein